MSVKFIKLSYLKLKIIFILFIILFFLVFFVVNILTQCWFIERIPGYFTSSLFITTCSNSFNIWQTSLSAINYIFIIPVYTAFIFLQLFSGNSSPTPIMLFLTFVIVGIEISFFYWFYNKFFHNLVKKNIKIFNFLLFIFFLFYTLSLIYSLYRSYDKPDVVRITLYSYKTQNGSISDVKNEVGLYSYSDYNIVQILDKRITNLPIDKYKHKNIIELIIFSDDVNCLGGSFWKYNDEYKVSFYKGNDLIRDVYVNNTCKGGTSLSLTDYRDAGELFQDIENLIKGSDIGKDL